MRTQDSHTHKAITMYIEVVSGREGEIDRPTAVIALAKSNYPNRVREIEALVQNPDEPIELRALGANWLGRIEHPETVSTLLRLLNTPEPLVRRQIVRRLGMVGDATAIRPLLELSEQESGPSRNRVRFAAGLIEHRLGYETSSLVLPEQDRLVAVDSCAKSSIRIDYPARRQVETCILDLAVETCAIPYDEQTALEIRVGPERWMLLFNRTLRGVELNNIFEDRSAAWGVLAERDVVGQAYFLSAFLLCSPTYGKSLPRLHMHDIDGVLLALGDAPCKANNFIFSLHTVNDYMGLAFEFEGKMNDDRLEVSKAQAALIETQKLVATALARPAPVASMTE